MLQMFFNCCIFSSDVSALCSSHPFRVLPLIKDFPGDSAGKASAYNAGDLGSIPGLGRSPGEGNGNHVSTLAWEIPWMEEPGRLHSMG